jgi:hypothetical protein
MMMTIATSDDGIASDRAAGLPSRVAHRLSRRRCRRAKRRGSPLDRAKRYGRPIIAFPLLVPVSLGAAKTSPNRNDQGLEARIRGRC